jgi:hypothetical protein
MSLFVSILFIVCSMPNTYESPGAKSTPIFRLHDVPYTQLQILSTLVSLHVFDRHNARLQCPEPDLFARKSRNTTLQKIILRCCSKNICSNINVNKIGRIMGHQI